jgi:hypothetical protein
MLEGVDLVCALLGSGFGRGFVWGCHGIKAQYLVFALTICRYL